jgi:tRNA (guanosine-2'-O-)-methyltransferase
MSADKLSFEALRGMLTEHRRERIDHVVRRRMRTLTVVVEDLRDPHNQAAVLRTAEGLGLLTAHVVDTPDQHGRTDTFDPARGITKDADKWMAIRKHKQVAPCVDELKAQGFAIYAGALDAKSVSLYDLDVTRPCAFVFGNEHRGVSPALRERADRLFAIPMRGFVESFNVSVAAAICLSHAVHAREAAGLVSDLSDEEREALREEYERKSLGKRLLSAAERAREKAGESGAGSDVAVEEA